MRLEGKMLPHEAEGFRQASATLFFSMCHECVTALESRGSALTLGSAGLGVPCGTWGALRNILLRGAFQEFRHRC